MAARGSSSAVSRTGGSEEGEGFEFVFFFLYLKFFFLSLSPL